MRSKKSALPAKLSPPRLQNALARERLFAWIDAQRAHHAAIWISGVPGAGKTTLVASYCQARELACLWYRCDTDDNDIGRFFALLGQAVDAVIAVRSRSRRPIFEAAHGREPRAFARTWFRYVFATLPRPFALVLDNLEHAALPGLPELIECAIEELPDGVTLLLTGRHAPPPALSGALVNGTLITLNEADLQFTHSESADYAHAMGLDPTQVAGAARRTHGWAAGLRLQFSEQSVDDAIPQNLPSTSAPLLIDYFAELLRTNVDSIGQHLLLVAALLPWIRLPLLTTLCGVPDAAIRLNEQCAKNFFTERVANSDTTYRLHPLLREYLLELGRQTLAPDVRAQMLRSAAHGFAALGEHDAAIDLSISACDWQHVTALLLTVFEAKLALGQLDQLAAWTACLPEAILHHDPELRYTLARLCFLREDDAALTHYDAAYQAFGERNDVAAQQLCAAGVLEWSYDSDRFIDHQRWTAVLRQPTSDSTDTDTPLEEHRLRLLNGRLLACFFDGDFDSDAERWADEILALIVPGGHENEKLSTAITLLGCLERHKRWDDAQLLASKMEALFGSAHVGMRLKILARLQIAIDLNRQTGNYVSLREQGLQARELAHEYGFPVLEFEAVAALIYAAQYTGDDAETRRLLAQLTGMIDPANIYHLRFQHQMHAWFEQQCGHINAALAHADALRAAVARSDMPARFRATWLQSALYVRFASGARGEACAELTALAADAEPGSKQILEANLLTLNAIIELDAGRVVDAVASLKRAWTLAAHARHYGVLAPMRWQLSRLCAFAQAHAILPDFTRELIERRCLLPPVEATATWPWRLRIQTFGQFALTVDGAALVFTGKVPRKPLALLKALIALSGPNVQGVTESALTDALWPDDDADSAHDAFNVALHRLRKLLADAGDIIRLQDGRLSLDSNRCWIDCRAFEQAVADIDGTVGRNHSTDGVLSLQHAMALYRGRFLSEDRDEPWSLSARERMRSKFNRLVVNCAQLLSNAGREEEALICYQRGIETDDLAEPFYLGAMQCMVTLKRPADGLTLYQRLERMLVIALGIKPSEASREVRRQLQEG